MSYLAWASDKPVATSKLAGRPQNVPPYETMTGAEVDRLTKDAASSDLRTLVSRIFEHSQHMNSKEACSAIVGRWYLERLSREAGKPMLLGQPAFLRQIRDAKNLFTSLVTGLSVRAFLLTDGGTYIQFWTVYHDGDDETEDALAHAYGKLLRAFPSLDIELRMFSESQFELIDPPVNATALQIGGECNA